MAINFIFHNRNHVRLVAKAIHWLQLRGHEINLFDLEIFEVYQGAKEEAVVYQLPPVHAITSIDQYIKKNDVIVTFNDWDPIYFTNVLARLRELGTSLVGIIEGCLWNQANRYRRCDYLLSYAPLISKFYSNRPHLQKIYIVGSPIIESSLQQPNSADHAARKNFVLVNYTIPSRDFPRKVDETWLNRAIEACEKLSLPFVVSKHPTKAVPQGVEISTLDFSTLIRQASVLITPSSTVIFEALAHGIPVVLYKSSDQPLQEFSQPKGAYEIIDHYLDLPPAILRADASRASFKLQARDFVREQISIDPDEPAWMRTGKALEEIAQNQPKVEILSRGRLDFFPVWHFQHHTGLYEEDALVCRPGRDEKGHCLFGLNYVIRKNGYYRVTLEMTVDEFYTPGVVCTLDVYENALEKRILAMQEIQCDRAGGKREEDCLLQFAAEMGFRIEVRLFWHGSGKVTVRGIYLEEIPAPDSGRML